MFKWYVVQAYSNCEKSVLNSVMQRAEKAGMANLIEEIIVPLKKYIQIKKGKKVEVERNLYPGYVLLRADLTNELWHLIKNVPKISGFISHSGKPLPLKDKEVEDIRSSMDDDSVDITGDVEFEVGESVKVNDGGPFDGFSGVVESVDLDKKSLVVSVSIFGRATPVNIGFGQVERISE